jgi:hypothetical protein
MIFPQNVIITVKNVWIVNAYSFDAMFLRCFYALVSDRLWTVASSSSRCCDGMNIPDQLVFSKNEIDGNFIVPNARVRRWFVTGERTISTLSL